MKTFISLVLHGAWLPTTGLLCVDLKQKLPSLNPLLVRAVIKHTQKTQNNFLMAVHGHTVATGSEFIFMSAAFNPGKLQALCGQNCIIICSDKCDLISLLFLVTLKDLLLYLVVTDVKLISHIWICESKQTSVRETMTKP